MGFGLYLKELLRERNMTIKQLSEISNISINTLYSITKRDSLRVDPVILKRIATALNISVSELVGTVDNAGNTDIGLVAINIAEMLKIDDKASVLEAVEEIIQEKDPFTSESLEFIRKRSKEIHLQHIKQELENLQITISYENHLDSEILASFVNFFNKLNEAGQEEAIKRVSELTEIPRYQRQENSENTSEK